MATSLTAKRLRLQLDTTSYNDFKDVLANATPKLWRANDLSIELGIFGGATPAPGNVGDLSNIASLSVEVRASVTATVNLMAKTVSVFDEAVTAATWQDGSAQHAVVEFDDSETNLAPAKYVLIVNALTSGGETVTLGKTTLEIVAPGSSAVAGDPPVNPGAAISIDAADLRYARFLPAVTGYTGGGGTKLDGLVTAGASLSLVSLSNATDGLVFYQLVAGTNAESSPNVIRPDDYDATTNAFVWKKRSAGSGGSSISATYLLKTAAYTILSTDGPILADVRGGAWSLTLPASPTVGQVVKIRVLGAPTHALNLAGKVNGEDPVHILDTDGCYELVYVSTLYGWAI